MATNIKEHSCYHLIKKLGRKSKYLEFYPKRTFINSLGHQGNPPGQIMPEHQRD